LFVGNQNPCTDLDKILHTHPHLSKEGFDAGLTPLLLYLGLGDLKSLKLKEAYLITV